MKKVFYTEWAYILGISTLALGTAFMEKADLGVSMVVAPALILYTKLSEIFSFFTFGMAEYLLQFLLIILLSIVMKKFKVSYLLSFLTTIIYGILLDGFVYCVSFITVDTIVIRILFYVLGLFITTFGVSLTFHTYISPAVYELFVKEVQEGYKLDMFKTKTTYDCVSCVVAIIMSFVFFGFGNFVGVKVGTIFCAFVNGYIISKYSKLLESKFTFEDGTKLHRFYK